MPPLPKKGSVELIHTGCERIAINLNDIDRMNALVKQSLFSGRLALTEIIWIDRNKKDEIAVEFKCSPLQAAAICDIIRNRDRKSGQKPTRAYVRKVGKWEKLASDAVLTCVTNGKIELDPAVFRITIKDNPPPARRLDTGEVMEVK